MKKAPKKIYAAPTTPDIVDFQIRYHDDAIDDDALFRCQALKKELIWEFVFKLNLFFDHYYKPTRSSDNFSRPNLTLLERYLNSDH